MLMDDNEEKTFYIFLVLALLIVGLLSATVRQLSSIDKSLSHIAESLDRR